ncbi:hypothetical protein KUC3_32420 [Alteromonas sp. KC3]|nr:hypothetical protein KUC3_32420 [Alteromonas sp. KC3]BCO24351.1 hypothetical protein KUC14_32200 [Alteromonas sp. KC14]
MHFKYRLDVILVGQEKTKLVSINKKSFTIFGIKDKKRSIKFILPCGRFIGLKRQHECRDYNASSRRKACAY